MLEWRIRRKVERVCQREKDQESWQGRGWKFSVENTEGARLCQPVQVKFSLLGFLPKCYSSLCIVPFFFLFLHRRI